MNYLHDEVDADQDDIVEVILNKQANVLLLDGPNYRDYQAGRSYRYHGGLAKVSPSSEKGTEGIYFRRRNGCFHQYISSVPF